MIKYISFVVAVFITSFSVNAEESLIKYESTYSVKETADRFESIAKSKGFTLFLRVDHQKNAKSVSMDLRPTEVIVFGNPKVGTLLMQCEQDVAIDLPQKVLVTQDENQKVWLSYNNPKYLKERHDIKGCDIALDKVSNVLNTLALATVAE